jgi:oligoendopeptidase F
MRRAIRVFGMLAATFMMMWMLASTAAAAGGAGAIPQRNQIDKKYQWRVEDIYANQAAWDADYAYVESNYPRIEKFRGRLSESPAVLLQCLKLKDSLEIIIGNLYVYAYLKLDEDNRKSEYQELGGRASALDAKYSEASAFIGPEILAMDSTTLMGFVAKDTGLAEYRFYLEDEMRQKAHILTPDEEEILALAGPLTQAPIKIFNMIDNADHKLGTLIDTKGDTIDLTYGRYTRILKGTDRDMRRIANDTVQSSWLKYINTLATNLGASIDKDEFLTKARKYNTALEWSLDKDNIPTSVYRNLIDAVDANLETVHKLVALRKKVLGYDTLYTYDLSVSLAPEYDKVYSYAETKQLLLNGLKPLGQQYLADFKKGLESGWVDVYENEGKGTGAYTWGSYTSHPYVLMNFDSTIESVFTLAHEMGHAMNGFYTNRNEPYIYHNHSLFTAEVASTCNEAILMKYLLNHAQSKAEKIMLLNHYINQIEGTFITQAMFAEFELAIHEQVEKGGAVSVDYFRKTYRDIFQKYYGPDLVIGPDNDMGCLKIYHFYRTYYVYQYATCYAAAQELSQKILDGDQKALQAYMVFLKTGSSKYPIDILKDAGVDMNSPEPIDRTLKLFGQLIDEMDQLLSQK